MFPFPSEIWSPITPRRSVQMIVLTAGHITDDPGDTIECFQMVMEALGVPAGQVGMTLCHHCRTFTRRLYTQSDRHTEGTHTVIAYTQWEDTHTPKCCDGVEC